MKWWATEAMELDNLEDEAPDYGFKIDYGLCPQRDGVIIELVRGQIDTLALPSPQPSFEREIIEISEEGLIYPQGYTRPLESEVPEPYRSEFIESCSVQSLSPKASVALSRRILQNILREEFEIKPQSLAQEIDEFIHRDGVPSHLARAVDAVRNIGNFAAHPSKDINTGEIVDVEPGEAEWLLDVLEALFDFAFVQP